MRRLVLFDIDGTLLNAGGAGKRAVTRALREVYGETGQVERYNMAGRTDPQILREVLGQAGLDRARIDAGMDAFWDVYIRVLRDTLDPATVHALPGAAALVDRVESENDTVLGLLTGNVLEGARIKVDAAGLGFDRFQVGAYGSDHGDRAELPAVAVRRARDRTGVEFSRKQIVIIGDTPFDISCGEALGVRTIATATGTYSRDELAECHPDHLFADLADTEAVWRAIVD
ncbi:HAD family hydrolase [Longimicrobium terrae]|uniref:Phosphoglycolate phosphatase-like HAD superfamily hydrolase n=1 Tax=Longimicrobium terrae TaxID=1639882 RepID=A0A841GXI7_9BACT|nr:HAD hydrolase-like protein [Longimicrobium terrae]MBB4636070.1 phosphoglycolate phosphatase-like HAD superfamily hydrolase [Longimicrobium terrae]MBB6070465.1 phosphoglycolate phosphatase-like HAD superfamily hydrolase [Longimicrobium terrae]NNC29456.1 HAD hydrolase-like protein [Longimicrobium terrae]